VKTRGEVSNSIEATTGNDTKGICNSPRSLRLDVHPDFVDEEQDTQQRFVASQEGKRHDGVLFGGMSKPVKYYPSRQLRRGETCNSLSTDSSLLHPKSNLLINMIKDKHDYLSAYQFKEKTSRRDLPARVQRAERAS
jgi:hypothetical protein